MSTWKSAFATPDARAAVARFAFAGLSAAMFAFYGVASETFHIRGILENTLEDSARWRFVVLVAGALAVAGAVVWHVGRRGTDALVAASYRAFLLAPLALLPLWQAALRAPARIIATAVTGVVFGWSLFLLAHRSPWGAALTAFDDARRAARRGLVITLAIAALNAWLIGSYAVEKCHALWGGWDLMIHNSLHYNIVTTGRAWTTGLLSYPVDHYGNHFAPIEHLSAAIYNFHRVPETLMTIQAIMVNAAALAVFGIARRITGSATIGVLLAASFGFNACIIAPQLYDFHEAAFLIPTLLALAWAVVAEKHRLVVLFAVLALNSREDAGLWVALFGFVWLSRGKRVGLWLGMAGSVWLLLVNFAIMPLIRASTGQPMWLTDRYSDVARNAKIGVGHTIDSVATNPDFVVSYVVSSGEKWKFLALLLLPVVLLPFRTVRGLLLVGPPIAFSVLANYAPMYSIEFHYTVQILPFLYVATVLGLEGLERKTAIVLAATCLVMTCLISGRFSRHPWLNARFVDAETKLFYADFGDRAEKYRQLALDVPQDDCAMGSGPLATPLSSRRFGYLVPEGPNCAYAFIDYSKNARQSPNTTTPKMRVWLVEKLRSQAYGVMYGDDRVLLIGKGRPTDRNDEFITRLETLAREEATE